MFPPSTCNSNNNYNNDNKNITKNVVAMKGPHLQEKDPSFHKQPTRACKRDTNSRLSAPTYSHRMKTKEEMTASSLSIKNGHEET